MKLTLSSAVLEHIQHIKFQFLFVILNVTESLIYMDETFSQTLQRFLMENNLLQSHCTLQKVIFF